MRNIKMQIEFDGSKYKGFQRLTNGSMTIQEKIESVLSIMANEEILLIGCGRTDAGVHALNYTANFHTNSDMNTKQMEEYLYKFLPEDILVKSIKDCSERFHSRYNALSKTYLYRINNNEKRDIFNRKYEFHIPEKLNIKDMQDASEYLIGTHDFQSFTTLKSKKKSTVKTIEKIDIVEEDGIIEITIKGNSFLWHMVRIITGTLVEVGKGNLRPEDVKDILEKCKREESGPKVPPQGLFLLDVEY